MNERTFSRGSRMLQASKAASTPKRKQVSRASTLLVKQQTDEPMDWDDEIGVPAIHSVNKTPTNLKITLHTSPNNEGTTSQKRFSEKENRTFPDSQLELVHLQNCANTNEVSSSGNKLITATKSGTLPGRSLGSYQSSLPSLSPSHIKTPLANKTFVPASKNTLGLKNSMRLLAYNADELKKQQDFAVLELVDSPPPKNNPKPSGVCQPLSSEANKRHCFSDTSPPKNAKSFYGNTSPKAKRLCVREETPYAFLGLRNIGLSCYMNAALQLLLSISKFEELLEVVEKHLIDVSQSSDVVSCLLEIVKCRREKAKVSSTCLNKLLTSAGKQFKLFQQADSHEFLTSVLSHVKNFYQKVGVKTLPNSIFEFVKTEESACSRCGRISRLSSTNSCVILAVNDCLSDSERSVFNGIKNTTNRRCIPCVSCSADADNDTAAKGHSASLVSEWDKFPECLLINLSRTERLDNFTHKSDVEVLAPNLMLLGAAEPFSNLPVTPFYLAAFVAHKGTSSESGHYVSWIFDGKQWLCCDDEHVTIADFRLSNISKEGCVFLYKRMET